MTYLNIVNAVLRRLRELPVSTVEQTDYSTMVGDFVNDAKRLVESRWNWSANRKLITTATLSDGTRVYALTGFGQDGKVLTAHNDTANLPLHNVSQAWMDRQNYTSEIPSGQVTRYCYRSVDENDDTMIELWPAPNSEQTLRFYVDTYQADLSENDDVLNIPSAPVIQLAVAMLAEEKGEAGGTTSARYFRMADRFLADAIMADAAKNHEEMIWYEV